MRFHVPSTPSVGGVEDLLRRFSALVVAHDSVLLRAHNIPSKVNPATVSKAANITNCFIEYDAVLEHALSKFLDNLLHECKMKITDFLTTQIVYTVALLLGMLFEADRFVRI